MLEWICRKLPPKFGVPLLLVGTLLLYIFHFPLEDETKALERDLLAMTLGAVLSAKLATIIYWLLLGLPAIALAILGLAYADYLRRTPAPQANITPSLHRPINFEVWGVKQHFTMWEAVFLWCELEPYSSEYYKNPVWKNRLPEDVVAIVTPWWRMFKEDAGNLTLVIDKQAKEFGWCSTSRENLKSYAEKKDKRPQFLFPEDRLSNTEWLSEAVEKPTISHHWQLAWGPAAADKATFGMYALFKNRIHKEMTRRFGLPFANEYLSIGDLAPFNRPEDGGLVLRPIIRRDMTWLRDNIRRFEERSGKPKQ